MIYLNNFIYNPGGENEGGGATPRSSEDEREVSPAPTHGNQEEGKEDKTIIEKIKEALKDWSNKDEADQEFDDTRP